MAKILAIDDEPEILNLLRGIVEIDGHSLIGVSLATRAVDTFRTERPDLILLDVLMPGKGGIEICGEIRSESTVPIIVVSGVDEEGTIIKCYEQGADDYILKPFSPNEIRAKIRVHLSRAAAPHRVHAPGEEPEGRAEVKGTLFGPYVIEEVIGRGSTGTVYRAHALEHPDRPRALKTLSPALGSNEEYLQRFLREAEYAKSVRDPHIVRIFEAGHYHGTYYYAMELVDGISLHQRVHETGVMTAGQALTTAGDILNALASVHEAGYVHRDVSAKNILLSREGAAKLADFGIALKPNQTDTTTTTILAGTPSFMAPEIVQGREPDIRADLYSLGVAVYFAVVGRPPFEGEPMQVMYQHVHRPIDIPRSVPEDLAAYIHRLTSKAPEGRPYSPGMALIETVNLMERHPVRANRPDQC